MTSWGRDRTFKGEKGRSVGPGGIEAAGSAGAWPGWLPLCRSRSVHLLTVIPGPSEGEKVRLACSLLCTKGGEYKRGVCLETLKLWKEAQESEQLVSGERAGDGGDRGRMETMVFPVVPFECRTI